MTWQVASTVLVAVAVAGGLAWYEHTRPPSKLVAMVAALAALAVAGRVLFAALPNVQATTDVALLAGYALGPAPGFAVGSLGALASNMFLGQGPWTPWQMLGWGSAGLAGAALAAVTRRRLGRVPLSLACVAAGLVFGAWMDLFTLLVFSADATGGGYLAIAAVSLPFNVAHAAGNAILCLAFGPAFVRMLARYRRRLNVRWERRAAAPRDERIGLGPAAGAGTAMLVLLAAGAALLAAGPPAQAGTRSALRYVERSQNADGGFGAAPGQRSSQLMTGWAVLGLEAAGRNPLDVRRSGRTPIAYMRSGAARLRDTGELERTILALRGAGLSARRFGGRDLVSGLLDRRAPDGSWERQPGLTAFGILALRAAGQRRTAPAVREAAGWLRRRQGADGGFSSAGPGGPGFVDETGAVLQALAAAGRGRSEGARRSVTFLRRAQNPDGGLGQAPGYRSNAQSTAWAAQGLAAAGRNPRRFQRGGRSPLGYLASLQQEDGSIRYSRSSTQTPVWVTAQALAALRMAPLPIRRPPARSSRAVAALAAAAPAVSRPPRAATPRDQPRRSPVVRGVATTTPARSPRSAALRRSAALGSLGSVQPSRPAGRTAAGARGEERGPPAWSLAAGAALGGALALLAGRRLRSRLAAHRSRPA